MDAVTLRVSKTSVELYTRKCSAQTPQSTCQAFTGLPKTPQFARISCARTVSMFPLFRCLPKGRCYRRSRENKHGVYRYLPR